MPKTYAQVEAEAAEIRALAEAGEECDLGHLGCWDHLHSRAYHSADCWCGETEATCTED